MAGVGTQACAILGKAMRGLVYTCLLLFILSKSAAPIKELYGPAPWLAYYDDYFFVNAQGVFGFINSHRPTLILSYTHDPLPPPPKKPPSPPSCQDHRGQIATDQHGRPLTCHQLQPYCSHNQQVANLCQRTCRTCESGASHTAVATAVAESTALRWHILEFANLPGDPSKPPWSLHP
jgi:hypothetical protein